MTIALLRGIPQASRAEAARLYWQAFGGKLGRVLGPETRALPFVQAVMRADQAFVAMGQDGRLLGMAGFRSDEGSFAGGSVEEVQAH